MASELNIMRQLWPYIWSRQNPKQKLNVVIFVIATLFATAIFLSVPIFLKQVISQFENPNQLSLFSPITCVILFGLFWMLSKIIDRLRHQSVFPIIANIIHRLCLDLFAHLQLLAMDFHQNRHSGEVLNIVSRTRFAIADFTIGLAQEILPIVIRILFASFLLINFYGWQYGAVLLTMFVIYSILAIKSAPIIVAKRRVQNAVDGVANGFIVDSLLNAETVKYFTAEQRELKQARDLLTQKQQADEDSLRADAKIHLLQNSIIGCAVIVLTLISGLAVAKQQMQLADFVMINSYILMFMAPLSALGFRYRQVKDQVTKIEAAFKLLQTRIR